MMLAPRKLKKLVDSLPYSVQTLLKWAVRKPGRSKSELTRIWNKQRIVSAGRSGKSIGLEDFNVRINGGGVTPFDLYEDIFVHQVYDFESRRPDPRILDCGSNIGMSILYFKKCFPKARVVGFEPDPTIMPFLRDNIERNGLKDVEVINAALAAQAGTITLNSDGGAASHLAEYKPDDEVDWATFEVPCVRLSDYLSESVDFMKMNIEGAEYEVLSEAEPLLGQINAMNIEYHRLPGVPCTLHKILELLDRNGFVYTVSDFGLAMYGSAKPPVKLDPHARFWRQIYASRVDSLVSAV